MTSPPASVLRSWSARATTAGSDAYLDHFERTVLPTLRRLAGHRGVLVLRRARGDEVEVTVLTLWTSMDAVRDFAGAEESAAVVEPAARTALTGWDTHAEHFELLLHASA
jgi:heme-degrading monooxygenase HmoA